jgi:predicted transcriptional regulator
MEIDLLELDVFQEYMEKYGEKTDEIDKIDVEIEELTVQLRELRGKKEGLQKEQSQLTLNLNCDLFGEKLKEIAEDIKTDETQSNVLQFSSMLLSVIDDKDLDAVTGILSDIERAIKRKRYLW